MLSSKKKSTTPPLLLTLSESRYPDSNGLLSTTPRSTRNASIPSRVGIADCAPSLVTAKAPTALAKSTALRRENPSANATANPPGKSVSSRGGILCFYLMCRNMFHALWCGKDHAITAQLQQYVFHTPSQQFPGDPVSVIQTMQFLPANT